MKVCKGCVSGRVTLAEKDLRRMRCPRNGHVFFRYFMTENEYEGAAFRGLLCAQVKRVEHFVVVRVYDAVLRVHLQPCSDTEAHNCSYLSPQLDRGPSSRG